MPTLEWIGKVAVLNHHREVPYKFYPDFVARLRDGRWLVVEYKGAHLYDEPDAREKRAPGELWATRSNTRCLFCMLREGFDRPSVHPISISIPISIPRSRVFLRKIDSPWGAADPVGRNDDQGLREDNLTTLPHLLKPFP